MNKWIKFPLITGLIGAILGIFFHPITIWRRLFPVQPLINSQNLGNLEGIVGLVNLFSFANIIDGLIIGIILGLIIVLFKKKF